MDTECSDEDAKKAAAAFASATPVATVKVTDAEGTQTLEVRKAKDDYYAKSSVVDGVYKVTKDLGEGVDKGLDDFRNKKVFDFGFNDPNEDRIQGRREDRRARESPATTGLPAARRWIRPRSGPDRQAARPGRRRSSSTAASPRRQFEITVVSNDGKRTEKVQIAPAGRQVHRPREGEAALYQLDANAVDGSARGRGGRQGSRRRRRRQTEKKK